MNTSHQSKIVTISSTQWDSLNETDFPFSEHAFISSLEDSVCVGLDSGWLPCHITLWEKQHLQGAICLYEKNNSFGEYIFDWAWAREYEKHGLNYYPKLVSAIPFTPATGEKLLVPTVNDSSWVFPPRDSAMALTPASPTLVVSI